MIFSHPIPQTINQSSRRAFKILSFFFVWFFQFFFLRHVFFRLCFLDFAPIRRYIAFIFALLFLRAVPTAFFFAVFSIPRRRFLFCSQCARTFRPIKAASILLLRLFPSFLLLKSKLLPTLFALLRNAVFFCKIHTMLEFSAMKLSRKIFRMVHNIVLSGNLFPESTIWIKIDLPGICSCCRSIKDISHSLEKFCPCDIIQLSIRTLDKDLIRIQHHKDFVCLKFLFLLVIQKSGHRLYCFFLMRTDAILFINPVQVFFPVFEKFPYCLPDNVVRFLLPVHEIIRVMFRLFVKFL